MRRSGQDSTAFECRVLLAPTRLEPGDGAIVADDLEGRRCVFLAALYRAEREIAEKLKTLSAGKPPWPAIGVEKAIPRVEQGAKADRTCRTARKQRCGSHSSQMCWSSPAGRVSAGPRSC